MLSVFLLGLLLPTVFYKIGTGNEDGLENDDDSNMDHSLELNYEPIDEESFDEYSPLGGSGAVTYQIDSETIQLAIDGKSSAIKLEMGSETSDNLNFELSSNALPEGYFLHVIHSNAHDDGDTIGIDHLILSKETDPLKVETSPTSVTLIEVITFRQEVSGEITTYANPEWLSLGDEVQSIWGYSPESLSMSGNAPAHLNGTLSDDGKYFEIDLTEGAVLTSESATFHTELFNPSDETIPGNGSSYLIGTIPRFFDLGDKVDEIGYPNNFKFKISEEKNIHQLSVEHTLELPQGGKITSQVDYFIITDFELDISAINVNILNKSISFDKANPSGIVIGVNGILPTFNYDQIIAVPAEDKYDLNGDVEHFTYEIKVEFNS